MRARRSATLLLAALVGAATAGCFGSGKADPEPLLVFAAASLRDVVEEAGGRYAETRSLAPPTFNFAGSNVLAQQILAAPRTADVYLSADESWMDRVDEAGRIDGASRRTVASNGLAVVARADSDLVVDDLGGLPGLSFRYLAVADPGAVPAGRYARAALEAVPHEVGSVWSAVRGRIAPAADVRAALALVETSGDALGVVYRTDAASTSAVRVVLAVPPELGPPIRYVGAVLAETRRPEAARSFLDFLSSPEGQAVFARHGFLPPGPSR